MTWVGSLLGKSCQGTLTLAGHSEEMQGKGYLFGKHLALAWQACLDREPFQPGEFSMVYNKIKKKHKLVFISGSTGPFSLVCAPLMFTLQHKPELYQEIEKGLESVDDVDYELLRSEVFNCL